VRCPSVQQRLEQSGASGQKAVAYLNHAAKRRRKNPILFALLWSHLSQHHVFPFTACKAQAVKSASLVLVLIIAMKSKHLKMRQKVQHFSKEGHMLVSLPVSGTVTCLYVTSHRPESKAGRQQPSAAPCEQPAARPAALALRHRPRVWPAQLPQIRRGKAEIPKKVRNAFEEQISLAGAGGNCIMISR